MTKKGKPPPPMAVLTARGLSPLSQADAEEISAMPTGTEFDLVKRTKRSPKHLKTYWKALGGVVKATGRWPTSEHLHDDLVYSCGFVRNATDLNTGETRKTRDSIAFDAMDQDEFNEYFKQSMAMLADAVGYDPLRFLEEPA